MKTKLAEIKEAFEFYADVGNFTVNQNGGIVEGYPKTAPEGE